MGTQSNNMASTKEIEARFDVTNGQTSPALIANLSLPNKFALSEGTEVRVQDTYLDTPDLRLLRHGHVVRIRRQNGQQLITLKSLPEDQNTAVQERLVLERSLGAERLGMRAWPREIRQVVEKTVDREAQWQLICTIVQDRERHVVMLPAAGDLPIAMAELSVDNVDVRDGDKQVQFAEVEVELLAEDREEELRDLAGWLGDQDGIETIGGNKLMRGLRAIAGAPLAGEEGQIGIQPAMEMADACRLLWRQQKTEMVLNEAGVRTDADIEFVHQMRVATRRARAANVLFGDFFKKKQARPHLDFFRRTGKRLGLVRDFDVAQKKLAKYRRSLSKNERAALKPLARHWQKERQKPMAKLLRWLDSDVYALALVELETFCATVGMGAKGGDAGLLNDMPAATQVRFVLPGRIVTRFEAIRRYESLFERERELPLDTLHALRIDCKYLRYVLEFSQHLLGEEGAVLIGQLKRLQDLLGDLNDADVARFMLQNLPDSLQNEAVHIYAERQHEIIEELRTQVRPAFMTFVDYPNRQLLANAIARI